VSAWNTQRVVQLNIELSNIRPLFVNFVTNFFGDELVEFLLNETRNGVLDTFVDLSLDLTRVINRYCEHVE